MLNDLTVFKCAQVVRKRLPQCEHSASMACHQSPAFIRCKEPCLGTLTCCTKACKAPCSDCQSLTFQYTQQTSGIISRSQHVTHPCERLLYCEHKCRLDCHTKDSPCNDSCSGTCRQQCAHHKCPKPCSEPCAPCMEPCTWSCAHLSCPVLCGSVRDDILKVERRTQAEQSADLFSSTLRRALPTLLGLWASVSLG